MDPFPLSWSPSSARPWRVRSGWLVVHKLLVDMVRDGPVSLNTVHVHVQGGDHVVPGLGGGLRCLELTLDKVEIFINLFPFTKLRVGLMTQEGAADTGSKDESHQEVDTADHGSKHYGDKDCWDPD